MGIIRASLQMRYSKFIILWKKYCHLTMWKRKLDKDCRKSASTHRSICRQPSKQVIERIFEKCVFCLYKQKGKGRQFQTLLGVTGPGKTFTMANIIQQLQKPVLIIAHNKTLAGQSYGEFKGFFLGNAVVYLVSQYVDILDALYIA